MYPRQFPDIARAAGKHARYEVAQVNLKMPRTHGDGFHSCQQNKRARLARSGTARGGLFFQPRRPPWKRSAGTLQR